jgi:pyruvate/2-oxoglutarate dehydrogenase complex dihydrolipoamide dehydrogenase (E3) component
VKAETYLAWHLARQGQQAMVIERRWIGGSCPNVNCLPTKNEIWSAKVAHLVRHAKEFGALTGPESIGMELVRNRKREMVKSLVAVHVKNYQSTGADNGRRAECAVFRREASRCRHLPGEAGSKGQRLLATGVGAPH